MCVRACFACVAILIVGTGKKRVVDRRDFLDTIFKLTFGKPDAGNQYKISLHLKKILDA